MIIAATATEERKGTFLTYHGPFEESIPRMAACGYEAAELHILDSAEIDRKKLWEILRQNHIRLTSVGTGSVYGQRHYNLVDSRREVRGAAIRHLGEHMITAQPYGGLVIVGLIAGRLEDCSGREEYRENLDESLYRLDKLAQEYGVWLGFELTNRYEREFLLRIDEGVSYLRERDFKRILLHIDTVHMNIEEGEIGAAIRRGRGFIGHVHVADNDRWYPGHGHYDFRETLKALRDIGYEGALALETNCLPSEEVSARKSLEYMRKMLSDLESGGN